MSSISQCQYNIQRYRTLKTKINSIISNLSFAITNTDDLNTEIKSKYQVNDNYTPIVTRTADLKKNITKTSNYLSDKIIPAIDVAISNLYKEIARLEEEQRSCGE